MSAGFDRPGAEPDDALREAGCFVVPPDHPFLPGHFPGDPVIPGVMLLERALELAGELAGRTLALRGGDAKFPAPARPGETVRVRCGWQADERLRLVALVGDRVVARGSLRVV